MIIIMFLLLCY